MRTIWVEASAGSGKTTFLISKLEEQFAPNQILFITFSNAAADELTLRIAQSDIQISTLHALAYKIVLEKFPGKEITTENLKQYAILRLFHQQEFIALSKWLIAQGEEINWDAVDGTTKEITQPAKSNQPTSENYAVLEPLSNNSLIEKNDLEKIKNIFYTTQGTERKKLPIQLSKQTHTWCLQRIALHEKYLHDYTSWVHEKLSSLVQAQEEQIKTERNVLYYEDLITLAAEILRNDSGEIFFQYFSHIKLLMIDEAQDLSPSQWKLVQAILTEWHQTDGTLIIASDPKQLIYTFQGANTKDFTKNKNTIKNLSNHFEETQLNHTFRLPKNICNFLNTLIPKLKLQITEHTTQRLADGNVEILRIDELNDIVRYIKDNNLPAAECMILFKQKTERMETLAHHFFASGFLLNSPFIMQHPCIKDFQHLLKYLHHEDTFSLAIIFNALGKQGLRLEQMRTHPYFEQINHLKKYTNNLESLLYYWLAFDDMRNFLNAKLGDATNFWQEILRRYAAFYKYHYIDAITDARNFYAKHYALFADGIFFNTIHASKGKEANFVFLCETDFKSKFKNDTDELLYVGLTRSKQDLIIPILNDDLENTWAERFTV